MIHEAVLSENARHDSNRRGRCSWFLHRVETRAACRYDGLQIKTSMRRHAWTTVLLAERDRNAVTCRRIRRFLETRRAGPGRRASPPVRGIRPPVPRVFPPATGRSRPEILARPVGGQSRHLAARLFQAEQSPRQRPVLRRRPPMLSAPACGSSCRSRRRRRLATGVPTAVLLAEPHAELAARRFLPRERHPRTPHTARNKPPLPATWLIAFSCT